MPTLTLEAIRENPRNVLVQPLPRHPSRLLLEVAHHAATYCRNIESLLMIEALFGNYTPARWEPSAKRPDIDRECEARANDADRKVQEIRELLLEEFGEDWSDECASWVEVGFIIMSHGS